MTSEVRTTIEASDVIAIEIQCKECGSRSSNSLTKWRASLTGCGNCGANWGHLDNEFKELYYLVGMLRKFGGEHAKNALPFVLRFEVLGLGTRQQQ